VIAFPLRHTRSGNDPDIQVLSPRDVQFLRLPWDGRFSAAELERVVSHHPNLSVWNTRTGEFLVGGHWRHRDEIATILELAGSATAVGLIEAWIDVCHDAGMRLVVVSEQAERRRRQFYEAAHLDPIEEIIIYELNRVRAQAPALGELRFEPFDISDQVVFDELLHVDHRAFPWMWWNSREEFMEYASAPGVSIDVGRDRQGQLLAYVGTTRYRSWGHLDRIAVMPGYQGHGFGLAALDYAVMTLARAGARRVGLSTQAQNERSRRLYERYGFKRSPSHDYLLYGRTLGTGQHDADISSQGE
jgi:ribosomal protein S18 acetylase RimI-like enzyme